MVYLLSHERGVYERALVSRSSIQMLLCGCCNIPEWSLEARRYPRLLVHEFVFVLFLLVS